jgi:hypothetical protein
MRTKLKNDCILFWNPKVAKTPLKTPFGEDKREVRN